MPGDTRIRTGSLRSSGIAKTASCREWKASGSVLDKWIVCMLYTSCIYPLHFYQYAGRLLSARHVVFFLRVLVSQKFVKLTLDLCHVGIPACLLHLGSQLVDTGVEILEPCEHWVGKLFPEAVDLCLLCLDR